MLKKNIKKIIWDFLYDHPMSLLHTQRVVHESLKRQEEMFFTRIPIDVLEKAIEQAKKSDRKYITYAEEILKIWK